MSRGTWDETNKQCSCGCLSRDQHEWLELVDSHAGDTKAARTYVARRLREVADIVERGGFPAVFGCDVPKPGDELLRGTFIGTVSVTLSYPWPR